ncbi:MAG: Mov34/MPN/PAD-1 family protein [Methanomicrobiaceae archaeon]|nr:Mov34/MPN/PAD-1 family protein [Methanomicrobiaceae archaeon]
MADIKIKKELLQILAELGKSNHPCEFLALLRKNGDIIDEFELAPGTITGSTSASFQPHMMPIETGIAGSAHSHPNGMMRPSDADLRFFPATGKYHIIIGAPYTEDDWRCFFADGSPCQAEVID